MQRVWLAAPPSLQVSGTGCGAPSSPPMASFWGAPSTSWVRGPTHASPVPLALAMSTCIALLQTMNSTQRDGDRARRSAARLCGTRHAAERRAVPNAQLCRALFLHAPARPPPRAPPPPPPRRPPLFGAQLPAQLLQPPGDGCHAVQVGGGSWWVRESGRVGGWV
jgi:hypothetical protein